DGGKTAECTITVRPFVGEHVTGVTLNKEEASLAVGEALELTAAVAPENAAVQGVAWSVTGDDAVTLSAATGKTVTVTGKAAGTAVVTVTTDEGGKQASASIAVTGSGGGEVFKYIAFTFDNATGETANMSAIVSALSAKEAYGTFFIPGDSVTSTTKNALQAALDAGCELGNTGKTGNRMNQLTAAEVSAEVTAGQTAFNTQLGYTPVIFRAPKMMISAELAANANMPMINGIATYGTTAQQIHDDVMKAAGEIKKAEDGAIVNFSCANSATAAAIGMLIDTLSAEKYKFLTVSGLAAEKKAVLANGKHYDNFIFYDPSNFPDLSGNKWVDITPAGFTSIKAEIASANAYGISVTCDPSNRAILYMPECNFDGGPTSGVFKSINGGTSWSFIHQFDSCHGVRVDPYNSNHLYARDILRLNTQGFWVSWDGGLSWAIPPGYNSAAQAYNVAMGPYGMEPDPADFNHVIMCGSWWDQCKLIESNDSGETFTGHVITSDPDLAQKSSGTVLSFLYDPATGQGDRNTWMYSGESGTHTWKTKDGGAAWYPVNDFSQGHGGEPAVYTAAGVVFMSSDKGVLRSADNGETWEQVTVAQTHISLAGDGKYIYSSNEWTGAFAIRTLETDGYNWELLSNYYGNIPKSQRPVIDRKNQIMYIFSLDSRELYALQLDGR
ncbi:MAG: polysaccharide deacetylase family protein, partial [Treponema sp.]|nr:polysaccharide deacetylase family protein [Treponema sp.]